MKIKRSTLIFGLIFLFLNSVIIFNIVPEKNASNKEEVYKQNLINDKGQIEDEINLKSQTYNPIQTYNFGSSYTVASENCSYFIACDSYSCSLYTKTSTNPLQTFSTPGVISGYDISGDGNYVALGDVSAHSIYFHNKSSSTRMWIYDTGGEILSLALSYNGSYLVASANNGNVYFFNKTGPNPMWTYTFGDAPRGIAITPDGKYFVVGGSNKVSLFNKTGPTPMMTYNIDGEGEYLDISHDGKYFVVGIKKIPLGEKCNIYLFNSTDDTKMWNYTKNGFVPAVAISSNGDYIVAGGYDYKVHFFNKTAPTPIWSYTTGYLVSSVGISSDGNTIVAGSWDYNGYIFNKTGSMLFKLKETYYINYAAISEDGKYILFVKTGMSDSHTYIYYWSPPKAFSLNTDAKNPDTNGLFNLTWTNSIGADSYSVYHSENYINDLDLAELIQDGIEEFYYPASNLNGDHYYVVAAYNESGITKSNNIFITISIPDYIIHINANWTLTNSTYDWCSGKGTKDNPFIMQNITVNGNCEAICIFIENTEDFFIIKNCTFKNGRCGIKLENVTNFNIINNTILDIDAVDGINGINYYQFNNGSRGNDAIGICINDCHNFNLSNNILSNLNGGNGGNGGIGKNAYVLGGRGGDGGSAICILISNSNNFSNSNNKFNNINGGNGGIGGAGFKGYTDMYYYVGGNGGDGGLGGLTIIISIENSTNIKNEKNFFKKVKGGNGGNGGNGGDGTNFIIPAFSFGGNGGKGGNGGFTTAIYYANSSNLINTNNSITEFISGVGGSGGNGGKGDGGVTWWGGDGGDGGNGGELYGFFHLNSKIIVNKFNNFTYFISGDGGRGGNGGRGTDGIINKNVSGGRGGIGGRGGYGGRVSGIYLEAITSILNYKNKFLNFYAGSGGNGNFGGSGGNGIQYQTNYGSGGNGAKSGDGGDGALLFGLYFKNVNKSENLWNTISMFVGGNGGNGSYGGNGGNGVASTKGGNGGNGGNAGQSSKIYGFYLEGTFNVTLSTNSISHLNSTFGGDGGNGGNGGGGITTGTAGNGGNGGNAELNTGVFLKNSNKSNNFFNNISQINGNKGGKGGIAGSGSGSPLTGSDGKNSTGNGFYLILNCRNNEFSSNNISFNSIGIILEQNSDNNLFRENVIHNNSVYGVIIYNVSGECNENLFYMNNFSNRYGFNAYDNGTNNFWDNESIGNWWHNYDGVDNTDDGIGEDPYQINGDGNAQDNFPIWNDGPEKIKPNIFFITPNVNNTQIEQSSYIIGINIYDHHPPASGNVSIYIYNSSYHLLFNKTMIFVSGIYWIFNWNNISLYKNDLPYIIKIKAVDSSLNKNENWSESVYIYIRISTFSGFPNAGNDDGGEGSKKESSYNFIEFLLSPVGLTVVGGGSGGICLTSIFLIKKRMKKVKSIKEKEKIKSIIKEP